MTARSTCVARRRLRSRRTLVVRAHCPTESTLSPPQTTSPSATEFARASLRLCCPPRVLRPPLSTLCPTVHIVALPPSHRVSCFFSLMSIAVIQCFAFTLACNRDSNRTGTWRDSHMMHDMSLVWPTPAEHANKHSLSRYLEVAVYVAQFPQYASALLDHLCDVKVSAVRGVSCCV